MVDTESAARLSAPVERFARSVGVFVVHFGATSVTAAALASLAALESAPDGIWVIDNSGNWPDAGDAEGTSQVHAGVWDAASWGGTLRVLRPERNLGYAGAVNLAFCSAMDAGAPSQCRSTLSSTMRMDTGNRWILGYTFASAGNA